LFLRTPKANVLWDCLPLLDEAVVEAVQAPGGTSAVGAGGNPAPSSSHGQALPTTGVPPQQPGMTTTGGKP
jgi:hypothetical protein